MTKQQSQIIIFLLAGILAVLLFGREATLGSAQVILWVGLAIAVVGLVILAVSAFVAYVGREVKVYKEEVGRERDAGRPWLFNYLAWPGIIGNFGVFGIAGYSRYIDESCRALTGDCLQTIPFYWVPVTMLLASIPFSWCERMILNYRNGKAE